MHFSGSLHGIISGDFYAKLSKFSSIYVVHRLSKLIFLTFFKPDLNVGFFCLQSFIHGVRNLFCSNIVDKQSEILLTWIMSSGKKILHRCAKQLNKKWLKPKPKICRYLNPTLLEENVLAKIIHNQFLHKNSNSNFVSIYSVKSI